MARPLMVNAFDPRQTRQLAADVANLLERRNRVLGPSYKLFYEEPIHVIRAEGVWLHGADGARYLDVYNNVPSVGHCHPRVVEAISPLATRIRAVPSAT